MARSLNGTSQYMEALITSIGLPCSFAAWIYPFTSAPLNDMSIFFLGIPGDNTQWHRLLIEGDTVGDRGKLRCATRKVTIVNAQSTNTVVANTWQHVCGIINSSSLRTVYLNGTLDKGVNTETRTPGTPTTANFGNRGSVADNWYNGLITKAAFWNTALTDTEVDALAAGASPLQVHRESLRSFWPFDGQDPEIDIIEGVNLTLYNSPPVAGDHTGLWGNHIVAPG